MIVLDETDEWRRVARFAAAQEVAEALEQERQNIKSKAPKSTK